MSRKIFDSAGTTNSEALICQMVESYCSRILLNFKPALAVLVAVVFALLIISHATAQQTLDQAVDQQLQTAGIPAIECEELRRGNTDAFVLDFAPQLQRICAFGGPSSGGGVSGGGSAGTTQSIPIIIQARLSASREEDRSDDWLVAALDNNLILEEKSDHSGRLNWFITANDGSIDRDRTRFEAGYDSDIQGLTGGVDYRFNDSLLAGLALDLTQWKGDYDIGGDFDIDSAGIIVFASVYTRSGIFVNASMGYWEEDYERSRIASWSDLNSTSPLLVSGKLSSDYSGDARNVTIVAGYDLNMKRFRLSPHAGLSYGEDRYDGYQEIGRFLEGSYGAFPEFSSTTATGLELEFEDDSRRSLQSFIGINASWRFQASNVVIEPQVFLDWHHEFEDNQRSIEVRFVQDNRENPQRFIYSNEEPDENFAYFGAGVSAVFANGLQIFLAGQKLLEHEFQDSVLLSLSIRKRL